MSGSLDAPNASSGSSGCSVSSPNMALKQKISPGAGACLSGSSPSSLSVVFPRISAIIDSNMKRCTGFLTQLERRNVSSSAEGKLSSSKLPIVETDLESSSGSELTVDRPGRPAGISKVACSGIHSGTSLSAPLSLGHRLCGEPANTLPLGLGTPTSEGCLHCLKSWIELDMKLCKLSTKAIEAACNGDLPK